jgi:hypothetical protein
MAGFEAISVSQASIGWIAIFRGYWSSEWLVAHQALVVSAPVLNEAKQKERYKKQEQRPGKVASLVMRQVVFVVAEMIRTSGHLSTRCLLSLQHCLERKNRDI